MRPLIFSLILILASVLSGCRTSMKSVKESSEIVNVEVAASNESVSNEDILSILTQTADLDLSGIVIEYYAPDSITPDARAAPKSVTIERATAKTKSEATEHKVASTADKDTVNVRGHGQRAEASDTKVEAKASNPINAILALLICVAVIALVVKLTRMPKL